MKRKLLWFHKFSLWVPHNKVFFSSILHYANKAVIEVGHSSNSYFSCKCGLVEFWPSTGLENMLPWMPCPSLETNFINHGLKNDEPLCCEGHRKVQDGCSSVCWGGTHTYTTAGCIPLSHRWTCSCGHNVAISAYSGAPLQVYPAVTCSISAHTPTSPHPPTVQALVRYKKRSEQYH